MDEISRIIIETALVMYLFGIVSGIVLAIGFEKRVKEWWAKVLTKKQVLTKKHS